MLKLTTLFNLLLLGWNMIIQTVTGDITGPENMGDIIITMNTERGELSALGRQVLGNDIPSGLLNLGSLLTFQYDENRMLHMAICHNLGPNGWREAPAYLRYCLDTLWVQHPERDYSIVQIGAGIVGQRYNADPKALQKAIEDSNLRVILYRKPKTDPVPLANKPPLQYISGYSPLLAVAA